MKKNTLLFLFAALGITAFSQTQPTQPATGYGGVAHPYGSFTTFNCDDGATGFMLYIPSSPHADSLPLVVFTHGFGEWNPLRYGHWIEHIVEQGNIVIFPRYQKSEYTTLATSFTSNAVTGIQRALDTIKNHPTWTQPFLNKVLYVGHSYGGLISANYAVKYATYGIPKPRAILMACPGYGSYPGGQLSSYSAMDSSIYMLDIFERSDTVVDSTFALQVFNQTIAVPYSHKNLVIHFADSTGTPRITSSHGESSCIDSAIDNGDRGIVMLQAAYAYTDATDFYCYWKLFDALEDCALNGGGCTTAFGDTYTQEYMGLWSNGQPVRPLEVRPVVITSTNDLPATAQLNIYPDPANDKIYIEQQNSYKTGTVISLYNMVGVKVYTKAISQDSKEVVIAANSFTPGVYFLTIATAKGESITRKVVITH